MALTPTGWRKFAGLTKERIAPTDPEALALMEARTRAKRAKFESGAWCHGDGVSVRQYGSYDEYVTHQRDKLDGLKGQAFGNSDKAVNMFKRRFELVTQLKPHASVICLGARRGEEVQAFIGLGHFVIGIDLNPGPASEYVVTGDFHALKFAAESVDCVYTNCLDHALELDTVLAEVRRVLKVGGIFICDIVYGFDEGYVVGDHDTMHWAKAQEFAKHMASVAGFRIDSFRDLAPYGSAFWTQYVMRKQ